jgi:hypothetical protein
MSKEGSGEILSTLVVGSSLRLLSGKEGKEGKRGRGVNGKGGKKGRR